ncbi:hypothetical protein HPB50_019128 [Hyalomma asiaticum]|uniref:Uncharacterized protein n=1 Tax=Hyalomma asiaticum TaxID=266040 RepID=A0ACB7SIZ7_HYAAI|nr:hypothetical protein HPB50_019128 [Hyalomma asiaticum]
MLITQLSEESPLCKDGFSEDERRQSYRRPSSSLYLTILAVVGISVLGIVLVFTCVVSRDTLYRDTATWIRSNLDHNIDPCNDFYRHVCAKFRGHDVFLQIEKAQEIAIKSLLMTPDLPVYFQRPWQKAAAMYQACVSFASTFYPQTGDLVKWMILGKLDLTDEVVIGNIDPAEMIVRGSLDLGIDILISITLQKHEFASGKRAIQVGEWVKHFSKWTNGTYTGSNIINHGIHSTTILRNLFEDESVGKAGLQYLVAWSIYRQLIKLTDPYAFRYGRTAEDACYEHVMKVMSLAIYNHYFNSTVPPRMVYQTKRMVSRIRRAFEKALNSSSWMSADIRANAINKLANITVYVGSPGQRLDPRFVSKIYESYPDVPLKRPFEAWIKALSLSTHYLWKDGTTFLYDEGDVNTYNLPLKKVILIPTAVMTRPLLYLYGPIGLNYGGLGMLSVTGEEEMWDDYKDSENLCDLVGTKVAYDAFASLPEKYKRIKLVGMDMSSEQLFFINHCVKWCAHLSKALPPHAPFRSRCIVPLMNMPEFAKAFNCAPGTPMNPKEKCSLW